MLEWYFLSVSWIKLVNLIIKAHIRIGSFDRYQWNIMAKNVAPFKVIFSYGNFLFFSGEPLLIPKILNLGRHSSEGRRVVTAKGVRRCFGDVIWSGKADSNNPINHICHPSSFSLFLHVIYLKYHRQLSILLLCYLVFFILLFSFVFKCIHQYFKTSTPSGSLGNHQQCSFHHSSTIFI